MHKRLQDFLQTPSTMAHAGYWAMLPKTSISLFIGIVFSILTRKNFCLGFLFISYPVIAVIVDMLLDRFKDKLWKPLAPDTIVPREWNITTSELVQYAKELPKIRLRRLLYISILVLLFYAVFLLMGDEEITQELLTLGMLWSHAHICFFFSAVLQPWLCKKHGLKKPTLIQVQPVPINRHRIIMDPTAHASIIHPYHSESTPTMSRLNDWPSIQAMNQNDPTIPGTPAWILAKHQDATHRSSTMDLDRMTSIAHPANIWHSNIHDDYHRMNHCINTCMDNLTSINNNYHGSNSFDSPSYSSTVNDWNPSSGFTDYSSSSTSNSGSSTFTQTNSPHTDLFNSSSGFGF